MTPEGASAAEVKLRELWVVSRCLYYVCVYKKMFDCEVFQAFRGTQCVNSELQLNHHSNRIENSWSFVPFLVAVLSKDIAYFHDLDVFRILMPMKTSFISADLAS